MKKLDTSSISDAAEMPLKSGTLQFLQDAYAEMLSGIVQALLSPTYNPATPYAIFGCTNSATAPVYNISSGVIFWQGELFIVPMQNFTASGGQVAVLNVITTQYTGNGINADPVQFTDLTSKNVHNIRQIIISSAASGSGSVGDYSTIQFCNFVIPKQINLTAPAAVGGINNAAQVLGTYPDVEVFVPANNNIGQIVAIGRAVVGDIPTGGVTITVTFAGGALVGVTTYEVHMTIISKGTPSSDGAAAPPVTIDSSKTMTGFQFYIKEWQGASQSIDVFYTVHKTS